ncbi:MAG TPA: AAA family ATPase [Gemmatales bacterium]|nr:AAA family ATPase [Gemmatales bacterium]
MAKSPVPDFQIQPAVRGIRNIIIALAGEAGDGQTCSALRLARGLSRTGSILLIDTEQGRSTQYAPLEQGESGDLIFDFSILHLEPPFSPLHYRAAVAAAARYQPEVLIIDSISHEHVGVGGILDIADKAPDNKHGRAFKEPRAQHRQFMGRLTQHPWFVILTMRASEVLPENKGDPTIWKLQCDKTLRNDCTAILPLSQGRVRPWFEQPWKQPAHLRSIFVPGRPVDEEMGSQLARWCQPQGNWNDPQETEDERPAN